MSRKIVRLTPDRLAALPGPCVTCSRWESSPALWQRLVEDGERQREEKSAWLSETLREWGSCGRAAVVDDVTVGYVVYAPPALLPGAARFPTAPVSPDAVLMTTIWVDPRHAGGGLGRMLVQGMARDLVGRGSIRAVEAFGQSVGTGRCLLPTEFLGSVGFKTHRPHPVTPRMRMDLRTALSWRTEVEAALERLIGVVRPAPAQPTSPAVRRESTR